MKAIVYSFIFILASFGEIYAQNYWQLSSGPFGGDINCIYRASGGKLFCGTVEGGIYSSTNNGLNWVNNTGLPNGAAAIYQSITGTLYAGCDVYGQGIYISTDNGNTWTIVNSSFGVVTFTGIANTVFAGARNSTGIYKSTNNGLNWSASNAGLDNGGINTLERSYNGILYAGGNYNGKIYRSLDSGLTWQTVYTTSNVNDKVYKIKASSDLRVFGCTDYAGIIYSSNNGLNWSSFSLQNNTIIDIEIDSNNYYAISSYASFYSPNNGQNWLQRQLNIGGMTNFKDMIPDNAGSIIAALSGTDGNVYKYNILTGIFTDTCNDIYNVKISSLFSYDSTTLFAGTAKGKVYKSSDNGATWSVKLSMYSDNPVYSFCKDFNNRIYAGLNWGHYYSSDAGETWVLSYTPFYNSRTKNLLTAQNGNLIGAADNGIFVSTNSGQNWITVMNSNNFNSLSQSGQGTLYASTSSLIYKSENSGLGWSLINTAGLSTIFYTKATPSNRLYAGTSDGIWVTSDGGSNWTHVFTGYEINGFAVNQLSQVYAYSNYNGILFSQTGNTGSWNTINSGLTTNDIRTMLITPMGYVFAGSYIRGLFKYNYFTPVPQANNIPDKFTLSQNYPNPFNPSTSIKFALPPPPRGEGLGVRLVIYDILGREITTLVNEQLQSGTYSVTWDASNYPSGVYLYKISAGNYTETKKMVLVK